jgi:hypothetical protein
MREIRLYGSEGGEIEANRSSLPLSGGLARHSACTAAQSQPDTYS